MTKNRRSTRGRRFALALAFLLAAQEITVATTGQAWADSQTPAATAPVPTTAPATPAPAAAPAPPSDLVVPAMNIHLKGFVDVYAQYNPTSAGTTD
ncbi:MAG: hypothetical protein M0Z25_03865, partial [Nitrospiraceae bacterium]|nr:hypothetical protein [Nitrospiraceae bacterium]